MLKPTFRVRESSMRRYQGALGEFRRSIGLSWAEVLRKEALALVRAFLRITPPRTKKKGEGAVLRDSRRSAVPVRAGFLSFLREQGGSDGGGLRAFINRRNGPRLGIDWDRVSESSPVVSAHHEDMRDRRGRVRSSADSGSSGGGGEWREEERIVTTEGALDQAERRRLKKVGKAKGGFAASAEELGGRVSRWIGRHRRFGSIQDNSKRKVRPRIRIVNRVRYISGLIGHRLPFIYAQRARAMARELRERERAAARKFNRRR